MIFENVSGYKITIILFVRSCGSGEILLSVRRVSFCNILSVHCQSLTDSSKHSLLSSISRSVWRILIHSFSSLSMSFLVCLISLTGWQEENAIVYTHVLLMHSLAQKLKTKWSLIDHHLVKYPRRSHSSRVIAPLVDWLSIKEFFTFFYRLKCE